MKFLELIKAIRTLLSVGMPPAIEDEAALRKWIGDLVDVLKGLVANTAVQLDDMLVGMLERIVTNDSAWDVAYALLKLTSLTDQQDDSGAAAERLKLADEVGAAITSGGEVYAVNPVMILEIIMAVLQAIKMFRDMRN